MRNHVQGPSIHTLRNMLKHYNLSLSHQAIELLWHFHGLLRKHNHDRDLTRILAFEGIVLRHYVDCMIVGDLTPLPSPLLDIGTGAGFPGLMLKIRYPALRIILAEHRPRRVDFLNLCIKELGLENITVFEHKVTSQSFQTPIQGVITRALETMDKTFLRTEACLKVGGRLIFMKGPGVDPEFPILNKRLKGRFELLLDKKYTLPHSSQHRRLIIISKINLSQCPN